MTITQQLSDSGQELTIVVQDRFDFAVHQSFNNSYANANNRGMLFRVDLSKTTYMDSSALGMILLLREHAETIAGKIVIKNPNPSIAKILDIAQFHKLMTIEN